MYITFLDVDVGTRSKVLNKIGAKFIMEYGAVPEASDEFTNKFNELKLDTDIIEILRNEYDKTGYTVSYTIEQLRDAYYRYMK